MLSIKLNQQLCKEGDKYTHNWCFYQAFDDHSIVVSHFFMCTVILVMLITTYYFYHLKKIRTIGNYKELFGGVFMLVYYLIYGWLITCMIKLTINIIIYYRYMRSDFIGPPYTGDDDFPINQPIVILSPIFLFFDYLSGVFLLSIFWLICYQWINQILQNTRQRQSLDLEFRKTLDNWFRVLKAVKYFNGSVRVLFIVFLVIEPLLLFFTQSGCSLPKVNAIYFYIDSMLVLGFYLFGYYVFRFMQKNSLLSIQPKDKKKVEIQYFLLLVTLICRMILNFLFKISDFYQYQPINRNCSDNKHKITTTIFLTLCLYFLHTLPIVSALYVYRPDITSVIVRRSIKYEQTIQSCLDNQKSRSLLWTISKSKQQRNYEKSFEDILQQIQNNGTKIA